MKGKSNEKKLKSKNEKNVRISEFINYGENTGQRSSSSSQRYLEEDFDFMKIHDNK